MTTYAGREIHLAARPIGWPTKDTFRLVEAAVPDPGPGQVLVANRFFSIDPWMRVRMDDVKSYAPPFEVGQVMDGLAVGEVLTSNDPALSPGDVVLHRLGWREYALVGAASARKVDANLVPSISIYLSVLGAPGLTAYVGLLDIAAMRAGDVVFVSGAAGAVGGIAGQIARFRGASRVIGSVGTSEKVSYVIDELGFDDAFNYRTEAPAAGLARIAAEGIDVYFDNVGGDHLQAAIGSLRQNGRVAMCGAISLYNATELPPGPDNLAFAVSKRLTLRGFLIRDHTDRMPAFIEEMAGWLLGGQIQYRETVIEGIEHAPEAFLGMMRGDNIGKMLVKLDAP